MTAHVDAEVPFCLVGTRRCLTDQQLCEQPWLADFIARFQACFEHDHTLQVWWFLE